jgi:hypothetical protein
MEKKSLNYFGLTQSRAKLRKATTSFVMLVCLSVVRIEKLDPLLDGYS